ncbi:hypothetical protein RRG08_049852 [Elysia crispata]|uniref:Uncharacterized protein n=1 Tax=Elysia crispata TaxID=231223 RepID=A0AAE0ZU34_9GAST|nr:hypothetical protein RRG08_049852 [Elysia crispata]
MSVYTDKEVLEMLENDWVEEELSHLEVDDVATVLAEQPGRGGKIYTVSMIHFLPTISAVQCKRKII